VRRRGVLGFLVLAALVSGQDHPLPRVAFGRFTTSGNCALCHSNAEHAGALRDPAGRGVAPFDLWRGSMMANAVRDPFFRAAMAAEVAAVPSQRDAIEAKCLRCHAPMAAEEIRARGGTIGAELLSIDSPLTELARDGVSCTACHQIEAKGLGEPASFSGGFTINGDREIYGPHANPHGGSMRTVVDYWPVHADHVTRSELCATCHTLFVETRDASGRKTGDVLPEQTPYLEWRNSSFLDERHCQDCHVPTASEGGAPIRTRIAREPAGGDFAEIEARAPVGRHLFVGGNTLIPAILKANRDELKVVAPDEALDFTIAAARDQLAERTARLEITGVVPGADFVVRIVNLAGHKLPTAHPSRRVWLRARVRARGGRVVFSSGDFDARGRIVGAGGEPLPFEAAGGPVAPHTNDVRTPDDVPVYEAILRDPEGEPCFTGTIAAGFLKDNRLLPDGWRADHSDAKHTAPRGVGDDGDFAGGGDRVAYPIVVPDDVRAYVIEVDLLYQALAPRFAAELFLVDAPEVAAFERMYEAADPRPVVVATARLAVVR